MKNSNTKILTRIILSIGILAIIFLLVYNKITEPRISYIEISKIFNEFNLTKELQKKLETTKQARAEILLKMEQELSQRSKQLNENSDDESIERFKMLREDYLTKKQQFEEDNNQLTAQYDQQIWKQLNQYINEYGKEFNYDYIFGTSGQGNLMYSKEKNDITNDVISYVNRKYKGE